MPIPAPDPAAVLTATSAAPLADLAVLVTTAGYGWLVRRARADGGWPARRVVSWAAAVLVLLVAVNGPVGAFADTLFWVHMVQHLLLIMVAPVLLVWAQPLRLLGGSGPGVRRFLALRPVRWATAPLTGLGLYTVVVVLTHLTGFQQVSATHGWVRSLECLLYLGCGLLFFHPVLGGDLGAWSLPFLLRFVVLAMGMGADTLTGVALMLTGRPLAPAYAATHPGWGPDVLRDQEIAGAIMWFGGDLLMMLLMIMVAVQWGRAGSDQQGLGEWLEGARRRSLLGAADSGGSPHRSGRPDGEPDGTDAGTDAGTGTDMDIDEDQRALDAYNAALAALHARDRPHRSERAR